MWTILSNPDPQAIDMSPLLAAFCLLFVLTGVIGVVSKRLAGGAPAPAREKRSGMLLGLAHTAAMLSGALFPWAGMGALPLSEGFAWAAVGAMLVAFAFQLWAMFTLGSLFTLTLQASPGQEVVARGPYRVVRHPGYLAQILFFVAFALACRNVLTLAVVLITDAIAYAYRIQVEERFLREALATRYEAYAAGRARLIPGLW
ncbi:MAG: isoprenylcysteine carboxylmethyltransferase family protein [Deltaproteobacteria bacterium]|nr:isoprenylcysteine carboxylmethyltransferase family protein [Deltaproteobacteria bacterium]